MRKFQRRRHLQLALIASVAAWSSATSANACSIWTPRIYFEPGIDQVRADQDDVIDSLVAVASRDELVTIELTGFVSSAPPVEDLERLALARAEAIREELIAQGVAGEKLRTYGDGNDRPTTLSRTDPVLSNRVDATMLFRDHQGIVSDGCGRALRQTSGDRE